jgi:hypothetical protein
MVCTSHLIEGYILSDEVFITFEQPTIISDVFFIASVHFTITTDEMRGMDMPFSPETLEEKPYNICISCPRIGQTCDGPNFLAMTIDRFCEWCKLRRDYLGWKNQVVADKARVSKISVERIMAGDSKDLRITTMQAVARALVNGTWGQSPCVLVTETEKEIYVDNPVIVAQCQHLQNTLDALSVEYKNEVVAIRAEAQKKIDFLREQVRIKDKHIELLHDLLSKDK